MEKCGSMMGDKPVEFTFDRPFIGMILHQRTGLNMFTAKVVSPTVSSSPAVKSS